jgi:hypothetical protein
MAKKLNDLPKDDQAVLTNSIETASQILGMGDRWTFSGKNIKREKSDEKRIGLCASCENAHIVKTQYNIRHASCTANEFKIRLDDPITDCTSYVKRGALTLQQMWDIAYLIEGELKGKVGF